MSMNIVSPFEFSIHIFISNSTAYSITFIYLTYKVGNIISVVAIFFTNFFTYFYEDISIFINIEAFQEQSI